MKRLPIAFRCFFALLFKGKISEKMFDELRNRVAVPPQAARPAGTVVTAPPVQKTAAPPPSTRPADGTERAVQVLALLQRDARLIDFFREDIAEYDDAQVGAAVRDMHASCRTTLDRYVTLEPVLDGEEGKPVTVEAGFDPGTIKLIGNVTGKLPARGVLRHHGWRARDVRLPDVPTGASRTVVAPAEVEIS